MKIPALAVAISVCALAVPAAGAFAAGAAPVTWSAPMHAGQTLSIRNINGDVTVERATDGTASFVAYRSSQQGDPNAVRIVEKQTDYGYVVCALWPNGGDDSECGSGNHGHQNPRNNIRVQFTVRVPDGVNVTPATVNGAIAATGLTGSVDAVSVNGNITIRTTGPAKANTVNGSIAAAFGATSWSDDAVRFTTVNGDITLTLPRNANAHVTMHSLSGHFSSFGNLHVHHSFPGVSGSAEEQFGDGRSELKLSTVNGSITLKPQP